MYHTCDVIMCLLFEGKGEREEGGEERREGKETRGILTWGDN